MEIYDFWQRKIKDSGFRFSYTRNTILKILLDTPGENNAEEIHKLAGTIDPKIGIHRVTLSKLERGQKTSLLTLIQLLRGLGELQRLENMIPEEVISPLQLAKLHGKKRKRASRQTGTRKEEVQEW